MASEVGIVMSLYDKVSPTLKAISGNAKAFAHLPAHLVPHIAQHLGDLKYMDYLLRQAFDLDFFRSRCFILFSCGLRPVPELPVLL